MCAALSASTKFPSSAAAYFGGVKSALLSVFSLVLMGTYVGLGALAHDVGLPPVWLALSTILVWAAPAQLIMISALGTGGTLFEVALAVTLSATRLFPMVVALLPLLRGPGTRLRDMLLPTHFTSISMWVESLRLLPSVAREHRIAFCNGLSSGYMGTAVTFGFVGYYLAAGRRTAFFDADVILSFDRAQRPDDDRQTGAGSRPDPGPLARILGRAT
jgi:hypothetical protein